MSLSFATRTNDRSRPKRMRAERHEFRLLTFQARPASHGLAAPAAVDASDLARTISTLSQRDKIKLLNALVSRLCAPAEGEANG